MAVWFCCAPRPRAVTLGAADEEAEARRDVVGMGLVGRLANIDQPKASWTNWGETRTPLIIAAESGNTEHMYILLKAGARPDARGRDGLYTPLLRAIHKGRTAAVTMLLKEGADPNLADGLKSNSPIEMEGAHFGSIYSVDLENFKIHHKKLHITGVTPLMLAAGVFGDAEATEALLQCERTDPNLSDASGRTPLAWAVRHPAPKPRAFVGTETIGRHSDFVKVVKLLLADSRVNPNVEDENKDTPLMAAIVAGDPEIVSLLAADPRVDLEKENSQGLTPLALACIPHDDWAERKLQILLKQDPSRLDPNKRLANGIAAIHLAALSNNTPAALCLLKKGTADVDALDSNGCSALHLAATTANEPLVSLLLSHGANPNLQGPNGFTALHKCVLSDQASVSKKVNVAYQLITEHGANPNLQTEEDGLTALMMAVSKGLPELVEFLIAKGNANLNVKDKRGKTVLDMAHIYTFQPRPGVSRQVALQVHRIVLGGTPADRFDATA